MTFFYGATINDQNVVGGYTGLYSTYQRGFTWTNAKGFTVFGGSWPPTFVDRINFAGEIVGQNAVQPTSLFLGDATYWKKGTPTDLGTLGGSADMGFPFGYSSEATGVNDWGQIVGWSTTEPIAESFYGWTGDAPIHAIYWGTNGVLHDLGTLPEDTYAAAVKINFLGQIIGNSGNATAYNSNTLRYEVQGRPFVGTESGGLQDLNGLISPSSGWMLNSASDINLWGQIVGEGTLRGKPHGFLLTPIIPNALSAAEIQKLESLAAGSSSPAQATSPVDAPAAHHLTSTSN